MSKFYKLKVSKVNRETADAVSIEFEIPSELTNEFKYTQGQYLTFLLNQKGQEIRRSYSLCSAPATDSNLKVAVKEVPNGLASTFLNRVLKEGDYLESMPPMGNFYVDLNSSNQLKYVGVAAGSGITPILSILKQTLSTETKSEFVLIYSNKNKDSIIFNNELDSLVKKFDGRLKVLHVLSRQDTGNDLLNGRLEKAKIEAIFNQEKLFGFNHFFICGPEEMIMNANQLLLDKGIDKSKIHFELFTTPVLMNSSNKTEVSHSDFSGDSKVKVIIDGIETNFTLNSDGASVLDAAMDAGADAPFSCKGAVCCTCKAKIISGKAELMMNYALTDKEVEDGYILTCQAHPRSEELVVDFDVP